ncbi:hypothetical protein FRC16_008651 [Serendipita sp. 398]|nr:hypothetical protein FRC16_008651 [Serendipita sp. 398]KAG8816748.1 hypothetical protein FRC18_000845 [Serendipita sp. 400]
MNDGLTSIKRQESFDGGHMAWILDHLFAVSLLSGRASVPHLKKHVSNSSRDLWGAPTFVLPPRLSLFPYFFCLLSCSPTCRIPQGDATLFLARHSVLTTIDHPIWSKFPRMGGPPALARARHQHTTPSQVSQLLQSLSPCNPTLTLARMLQVDNLFVLKLTRNQGSPGTCSPYNGTYS